MQGPTYHDWYEARRPELTRHGLWLRGGELNTLEPAAYAARDFRVMFVRMSSYWDTGYSFTHQLLYQLAAGLDGVYPDLAYLPPARDGMTMRADGVPWLLGTQSKRGPADFDLVGFSNSIVQELANLAPFLDASGIPLGKRERLEREDLPLLVLGGANSLYTTSLWGPNPPVDGIFVGESDTAIEQLLVTCRTMRRAGKPKGEILDALDRLPGFILPDRPKRTAKAFIPKLDASQALVAGPVYYIDEQIGTSHLQISEGCPCFCSFCAESWDRKPYRERSARSLAEVALASKAAMGLDAIELYSFNFNMHAGFYQVLWDLVPLFKGIGLKSQRFDLLAHDPEMVEFQHAIEKASLTCGLEGISPRMRRYLHKNLEHEDLHASLAAIFKSRARQLKVFLIATGLEEEQDLIAFSDLLAHVAAVRAEHRATTRVVWSITPLVRFPWTPLEFEDAPSMARVSRITAEVAKRARAAGFEFRASADEAEYWLSQVLIRAADPRVFEALVAAGRTLGYAYHHEVGEDLRAAFEAELVARGLDPVALLRGHTLAESRDKPWALVQTGVFREFLWAEVERAREYTEIDYCLGRAWTEAKCFRCGGCPTSEHVADIVLSKQVRPYRLDQFQARIKAARADRHATELWVDVGPAGTGVPRAMVGAAVARALMLELPELAASYVGYAGSAWEAADKGPVNVSGRDVIALEWRKAGLPLVAGLWRNDEARARLAARLGDWARLVGPAPAGWSPSTLELAAPYPYAGDAYLRILHLDHTRRRAAEGVYAYDLSKKALKRGILRSMTVSAEGGGARVRLELGPKFREHVDPRELARRLFALPGRNDWVRVQLASRAAPDPRSGKSEAREASVAHR